MRPDSDRGVSSVVGVVLLLGITIVGTGAVVGLGAQAFADTERTATVSQVEHSLTQFDSQAAIVALGESSSQRVDLGASGNGEFVTDSDAGWMRVEHYNATGNENTETIYNESMGSVSYRNGDTEIGYQGGGVWERRGNGSTMRSPPEFNYRGATLTLPAIRVNSNAEASGQTSAIIRQDDSEPVYPSNTTYNNSTERYANPVDSGNVTVTVQSQFYDGWAEFFRTRTTGNVSVNDERERAHVKLVTTDILGEFSLSETIGEEGVTVRGQAPGHSLTDFNTTFINNNQGKGTTFYDSHIGFYLESGNKQFEYIVHIPDDGGENIELSIFYRDTQTDVQHEWSNDTIPVDTGPIRVEDGGKKLVVNLTTGNATHGTNLTYGTADNTGEQGSWDDEGMTQPENIPFKHKDDQDLTSFDTGDEATTYLLTRHYVALLGDEFTIYGTDRGSGEQGEGKGTQIDSDASGGVFDYESDGGTYITYLHVTENGIEVEFE